MGEDETLLKLMAWEPTKCLWLTEAGKNENSIWMEAEERRKWHAKFVVGHPTRDIHWFNIEHIVH